MRSRIRRVAATVTSWPFVVALTLLLANDWWLKSTLPNVVSGKLSDFAGLGVVGLLVAAASPRRRRALLLGTGAAFVWWKSSLSDSAISLVNDVSPYPIGRTVDLTDLAALVVLVFCGRFVETRPERRLEGDSLRRIAFAPLAALAVFAIMGTSVMRGHERYVIRRSPSGQALEPAAVGAVIDAIAREHGLEPCLPCGVGTGGAERVYLGEGLGVELRYRLAPAESVSFEVTMPLGGRRFFASSGPEAAEALRNALKSALARRFVEVEYVERVRGATGIRTPAP